MFIEVHEIPGGGEKTSLNTNLIKSFKTMPGDGTEVKMIENTCFYLLESYDEFRSMVEMCKDTGGEECLDDARADGYDRGYKKGYADGREI